MQLALPSLLISSVAAVVPAPASATALFSLPFLPSPIFYVVFPSLLHFQPVISVLDQIPREIYSNMKRYGYPASNRVSTCYLCAADELELGGAVAAVTPNKELHPAAAVAGGGDGRQSIYLATMTACSSSLTRHPRWSRCEKRPHRLPTHRGSNDMGLKRAVDRARPINKQSAWRGEVTRLPARLASILMTSAVTSPGGEEQTALAQHS
ncbi:hypothetical protein ZWY2020_019317 [Hordeum vulgare]|nr:hypothetical protein ZWY2020_019317 [Hordeum vulgare]